MIISQRRPISFLGLLRFLLFPTLLLLSACTAGSDQSASSGGRLVLPQLEPVALHGRALKVVATTSIIGDVVTQIGGDAIDLTILIAAGQDAHSFTPAAQELTAVADADVIFVNGWDLEESLIKTLKSAAGQTPLLPVSAGIEPRFFDASSGKKDGRVDPHVWFSVANVGQWVKNIAQVLTALDPDHAELYAANASAYQSQLDELDRYARTTLASIPPEKRFLVTNHGAFGYLARDYNLQVVGTVIPSMSSMAEPSASDFTALIETMRSYKLCTLFSETTSSSDLAQTIASELKYCDQVQVLPLYTGSLGPTGSAADSYIGMFRTNVDTIVTGLR